MTMNGPGVNGSSNGTNGVHAANGTNGAHESNDLTKYTPRGASGIGVHTYVPEMGYREYWYPGVEEKDIKRKPVAMRLLGDQVVFFRDANNKVVALADACPHRGAFLSGGISSGKGNHEFQGFITCPYHGYTYDGTGQCVAALTDGPNSKLAPKLKARNYPTETHKGIVYIWMGQTEPVPLKEDLPEEFFDDTVSIESYVKIWPMNWSLTMENSRDSHNSKIHRGQYRRIFNLALFNRLPAFWEGTEITEEGDNYICIAPRVVKDQEQGYFPGLGKKWPQHIWWRYRGSENPLKARKKAFDNDRPGGLYRLPSIACPSLRFSTVLLRYFTPIDADNVRMFSFAFKRVGKNPLVKLWWKIYYNCWWVYFNSPQSVNEKEDLPVQAVGALDTTAPQKLGATDAAIIFWRRRMPFKSRDAQRVWGKTTVETAARTIEEQEDREAVEIPLLADDD